MTIGSHIMTLIYSSTEVTRVYGCLVFMSLELPMTRVPPWRCSHASGFEAAVPVAGVARANAATATSHAPSKPMEKKWLHLRRFIFHLPGPVVLRR